MDLSQIAAEVTAAAEELIAVARPKEGRIFVLGCSTSEVLGSAIGTARSPETAETIISAVLAATRSHGLFLAVQCCEHLNRALVVPEAGGSAASRAYELFDRPVVVESVTADLGLDIGQTLIGMHLKRVAVPVRLSVRHIGDAVLTAARTRPPLIGGERAKYF